MKTEKILTLLSEGFTQAEIAEKLEISISSVEKHINAAKKSHAAKTLFHLAVILYGNPFSGENQND